MLLQKVKRSLFKMLAPGEIFPCQQVWYLLGNLIASGQPLTGDFKFRMAVWKKYIPWGLFSLSKIILISYNANQELEIIVERSVPRQVIKNE